MRSSSTGGPDPRQGRRRRGGPGAGPHGGRRGGRAAVVGSAGSGSHGMAEHEAAATLVAACRRRGLTAPVVLVAADERIAGYRHPIPRGTPVDWRVMLVVCAELGGLYVSLTRIVHLEEPDKDFRRRQGACEQILRRLRKE